MYKTAIEIKAEHPELTDFLDFIMKTELPIRFIDGHGLLELQLDYHSRQMISWELLSKAPQEDLARMTLEMIFEYLKSTIAQQERKCIGKLYAPMILVGDGLVRYVENKIRAEILEAEK